MGIPPSTDRQTRLQSLPSRKLQNRMGVVMNLWSSSHTRDSFCSLNPSQLGAWRVTLELIWIKDTHNYANNYEVGVGFVTE